VGTCGETVRVRGCDTITDYFTSVLPIGATLLISVVNEMGMAANHWVRYAFRQVKIVL
jgi:hypothetical protein